MPVFNSRFSPRVPADFTATVRSLYGEWMTQVENFSTGGMQLLGAGAELSPGELLEMQFQLPSGPQQIACLGEVVYQTGERLGVRFAWVSPEEQRLLARFMNQRLGKTWYH